MGQSHGTTDLQTDNDDPGSLSHGLCLSVSKAQDRRGQVGGLGSLGIVEMEVLASEWTKGDSPNRNGGYSTGVPHLPHDCPGRHH